MIGDLSRGIRDAMLIFSHFIAGDCRIRRCLGGAGKSWIKYPVLFNKCKAHRGLVLASMRFSL